MDWPIFSAKSEPVDDAGGSYTSSTVINLMVMPSGVERRVVMLFLMLCWACSK